MFCKNCGNEVDSSSKTCPFCETPLDNSFNNSLDTIGWKTSEIKTAANTLVNREGVEKKKIFGLGFFLPYFIGIILIVIISLFFLFISPFASNFIHDILIALLASYLLSVIMSKSSHLIQNGRAKFNFAFYASPFIFAIIFIFLLDVIFKIYSIFALTTSFYSLAKGNFTSLIVCVILFIIVLFIVSSIFTAVLYTAASRNYSFSKTLNVGLKIGFKYFFKILILNLSFIPLSILIGITFGILSIWKGFYMMTAENILLEKCLQKEGF